MYKKKVELVGLEVYQDWIYLRKGNSRDYEADSHVGSPISCFL